MKSNLTSIGHLIRCQKNINTDVYVGNHPLIWQCGSKTRRLTINVVVSKTDPTKYEIDLSSLRIWNDGESSVGGVRFLSFSKNTQNSKPGEAYLYGDIQYSIEHGLKYIDKGEFDKFDESGESVKIPLSNLYSLLDTHDLRSNIVSKKSLLGAAIKGLIKSAPIDGEKNVAVQLIFPDGEPWYKQNGVINTIDNDFLPFLFYRKNGLIVPLFNYVGSILDNNYQLPDFDNANFYKALNFSNVNSFYDFLWAKKVYNMSHGNIAGDYKIKIFPIIEAGTTFSDIERFVGYTKTTSNPLVVVPSAVKTFNMPQEIDGDEVEGVFDSVDENDSIQPSYSAWDTFTNALDKDKTLMVDCYFEKPTSNFTSREVMSIMNLSRTQVQRVLDKMDKAIQAAKNDQRWTDFTKKPSKAKPKDSDGDKTKSPPPVKQWKVWDERSKYSYSAIHMLTPSIVRLKDKKTVLVEHKEQYVNRFYRLITDKYPIQESLVKVLDKKIVDEIYLGGISDSNEFKNKQKLTQLTINAYLIMQNFQKNNHTQVDYTSHSYLIGEALGELLRNLLYSKKHSNVHRYIHSSMLHPRRTFRDPMAIIEFVSKLTHRLKINNLMYLNTEELIDKIHSLEKERQELSQSIDLALFRIGLFEAISRPTPATAKKTALSPSLNN
jgi:hypothetical protein